ncbi:MAG: formylglycine-generating enzyme family protein [Phaeodactylibacter sp.]|nr:formylglycine-generating enzyme family protein [Phaeodactylibacter sp.]
MPSTAQQTHWTPNETERLLPHHEMIFVPGGSFMMGDDEGSYVHEKLAHEVRLDSFFMAKYPVTQALWEAVMGNNPSYFQAGRSRRRPVEQVSWQDAQEFVKALNSQTGRTYRLPTEAEWEYAA